MSPVEFWSLCSMNGLILDDEQMERLTRYATDLVHFNEKLNLISRRDTEHVWLRHILHSLTPVLMDLVPDSGRVLDIGSGGGLPGIPIKIARPGLDMVLLDSIAKKVKTTEMLASHVIEHGLVVLRERAEELPKYPEYAAGFDLIIARAVAPLVDLITWARPLLKPDGQMVLLKGGTLIDEMDHAVGKHPDAQITIHDIELVGLDWFAQENKRIVTVRLNAVAPDSESTQGEDVSDAGSDTGEEFGTDAAGAVGDAPPSPTGEIGPVDETGSDVGEIGSVDDAGSDVGEIGPVGETGTDTGEVGPDEDVGTATGDVASGAIGIDPGPDEASGEEPGPDETGTSDGRASGV